jgi:hypothetical protein
MAFDLRSRPESRECSMSDERPLKHWVDRVREYRETVLYPKLFGQFGQDCRTLPIDLFGRAAVRSELPRHWLSYSVLTFAPSEARPTWLYATSGMSNDWIEVASEQRSSGLGCEFVLQTSEQSEIAVEQLLYLMALQLLSHHGLNGARPRLGDFDRVAVLESSALVGSPMRWLMLAPPLDAAPQEASLHSGRFDLYQVTALTESEGEYARSRGGYAMIHRLEQAGAYPVVDWFRTDVV